MVGASGGGSTAGGTRPPLHSAGHQQHAGPLVRRGEWEAGGAIIPPVALGTPTPQERGGLWHIHGHPEFQGPGKGAMSLHFLLTEGKVKGACKGRYQTSEAGRSPGEEWWYLCPGHSAQPGGWILLSLSVPHWCPRIRGEKGSEVPPYPLSPSQGHSSGPAQGRRWRGWYPGQIHLGGMWKAG